MMQPVCAERRRLRLENLASSYGQPNISQVLLSILSLHPATSLQEFPRNQFPTGSPLSPSPSLRDLRDRSSAARFRLLGEEIDGHPASDLADAANQLGALGCRDDAAGGQQIEKMGTLQAVIVSGEERKAPILFRGALFIGVEQLAGLLLMQLKEFSCDDWIGILKVVGRELLLFEEPY